MKAHSIISNTISEEILHKGHLSIRFMMEGFSLLLEDKNYHPVVLNKFSTEGSMSLTSQLLACEDWLQRHTLIDDFSGEVSIIHDSSPALFVPESLFSEKDASLYLEPLVSIPTHEYVRQKEIKGRPVVLVCLVPGLISSLTEKFSGPVRIIPASEVMLSMAEQVNAADHQRGFMLIEAQHGLLNILMIKEDGIVLSNQLTMSGKGDLVYHILNAMQHLGFDRKNRPLFYAGLTYAEEMENLQKYIKTLVPLAYHIFDIDKSSIPEHILLAEATRCG
ncbi:MAG: DUF3822 family protein [Bacteroidales bacterium]